MKWFKSDFKEWDKDNTPDLSKLSHDELRAYLDRLNGMDRGEAAQIITEVLKRVMDCLREEMK